MTIYDLVFEEDHSELYNLLSNPSTIIDPVKNDLSKGKIRYLILCCLMFFFFHLEFYIFRKSSLFFLSSQKRRS